MCRQGQNPSSLSNEQLDFGSDTKESVMSKKKVIVPRHLKDWTKFTTQINEKTNVHVISLKLSSLESRRSVLCTDVDTREWYIGDMKCIGDKKKVTPYLRSRY